jgi:pantetheine-phosphate adenylyltransferase
MKKVVYPGSFDPVTLGHLNIIERISRIFDEVIILVADSARKKYMFSAPERAELLKMETRPWRNVKVDLHRGLTIDYAREHGASLLVRSMRHMNDWELEVTMAQANKKLDEKIDTLFLVTDPSLGHVSSSLVREIAINHGNLAPFVTPNVAKAIQEKVKSLELK